MTFRDGDGMVFWSIASDGPRIEDGERLRIFDVFFQGKAAKETAAEGTGFGLGVAQIVATALGTCITVEQESEPSPNGSYRTVFAVELQTAPERVVAREKGRTDRAGTRRPASGRRSV